MSSQLELDPGVGKIPRLLQAGVIDRNADSLAGLEHTGRSAAGVDLHGVREAIGKARCPKALRDAGLVQCEQGAVAVVGIAGLQDQNRRGHRRGTGVFIFDVERVDGVAAERRRQDELRLELS